MGDYVPGVPQQPILLTLDGNGFLVLRTNSVKVEGIAKTEIVMSPFDWTKGKLGLGDEDLDKSEDVYGVVRRSYPSSDIFVLSSNPEKPIWLLLCGFNGEEINVDNPKLLPIIQLRDQINSKDKRIQRLNTEVESLREENRDLIAKTLSWKTKMKEIVGEEGIKVLPEELLGMRIGEKGVKR